VKNKKELLSVWPVAFEELEIILAMIQAPVDGAGRTWIANRHPRLKRYTASVW